MIGGMAAWFVQAVILSDHNNIYFWGEDIMDQKVLEKLAHIRCFLLDMDGTIYLGENLLPGAKEFIEYLKTSGRSFLFLTNNSSQNREKYVEKLRRLDIDCGKEDILTSGEATCSYLAAKKVSRVYLLGTPALEEEFVRWGFELTADHPEVVVLGFDKTLTYEKLEIACRLLRAGVPFVATHPDINCPTENGYIPDCGAMTELITASSEKTPKVIGKPNKEIIEGAFRKRKGFPREAFAMVGDRLYTDVATGVNAGICSILVLSGESTPEDVVNSTIKPTMVLSGVGEILEILKYTDGLAKAV